MCASGEWVRYRVTFGAAVTVLKYEVAEVKDGVVRFKTTVEQGGEFMPPLPDEIEAQPILESLPALGKVLSSKAAREKVMEVMADVLKVSLEWGDTPVEIVFTNAVPALGLFVARAGGETVLEAVAWEGPRRQPRDGPGGAARAQARARGEAAKPEPTPDPCRSPSRRPRRSPSPSPSRRLPTRRGPRRPTPPGSRTRSTTPSPASGSG